MTRRHRENIAFTYFLTVQGRIPMACLYGAGRGCWHSHFIFHTLPVDTQYQFQSCQSVTSTKFTEASSVVSLQPVQLPCPRGTSRSHFFLASSRGVHGSTLATVPLHWGLAPSSPCAGPVSLPILVWYEPP